MQEEHWLLVGIAHADSLVKFWEVYVNLRQCSGARPLGHTLKVHSTVEVSCLLAVAIQMFRSQVYALTRHLDNVRDVRVKAHSCDFAWGWMAEKLTLASEGHMTLQ